MTENKYSGKKTIGRKPRRQTDPFVMMKIYLPRHLAGELNAQAKIANIPASEIAVINLFRLYTDSLVGLTPYLPWSFVSKEELKDTARERVNLYEFILKSERGFAMNQLIMLHKQIGIENKSWVKPIVYDLALMGLVKVLPQLKRADELVRAVPQEKLKRIERFKTVAGEPAEIDGRSHFHKRLKRSSK